MRVSEFNLIERYFTWDDTASSVIKGVGDDAALIDIPREKYLVTSVDTSIAGVHFPINTSAFDVAYKSLAVNLSDLAAMGAIPKWFTLAITLPSINKPEDIQWIEGFSHGLKELARQSGCDLIGGDTTEGNLSITIQMMGVVDKEEALLRSSAKPGDLIYVTGTLGDAAIGLATLIDGLKITNKDDLAYCQQRLNQPTPRIAEGQIIKRFANACIDISDGLLQDLGHILKASQLGAVINTQEIPLSTALKHLKKNTAIKAALAGGDDYELLFTIPQKNNKFFLNSIDFKVSCIGELNQNTGIIVDENGDQLKATGYNHFDE